MNLNSNPTTNELSTLIAMCNDNAGNHMLWVDKFGDVHINLLTGTTSVDFQNANPTMAIRHETFQQGNNYVGLSASRDTNYISQTLNNLIREWKQYSGHGVVYIG